MIKHTHHGCIGASSNGDAGLAHRPSAWSAPCGAAAQVGAEHGVCGGRGSVRGPRRRRRPATAATAIAVAGHLLLLFAGHARRRDGEGRREGMEEEDEADMWVPHWSVTAMDEKCDGGGMDSILQSCSGTQQISRIVVAFSYYNKIAVA